MGERAASSNFWPYLRISLLLVCVIGGGWFIGWMAGSAWLMPRPAKPIAAVRSPAAIVPPTPSKLSQRQHDIAPAPMLEAATPPAAKPVSAQPASAPAALPAVAIPAMAPTTMLAASALADSALPPAPASAQPVEPAPATLPSPLPKRQGVRTATSGIPVPFQGTLPRLDHAPGPRKTSAEIAAAMLTLSMKPMPVPLVRAPRTPAKKQLPVKPSPEPVAVAQAAPPVEKAVPQQGAEPPPPAKPAPKPVAVAQAAPPVEKAAPQQGAEPPPPAKPAPKPVALAQAAPPVEKAAPQQVPEALPVKSVPVSVVPAPAALPVAKEVPQKPAEKKRAVRKAPEKKKPSGSVVAKGGGGWIVQFGAFQNEDHAKSVLAKALALGLPVTMSQRPPLFVIRSASVDRVEAKALADKAKAGGVDVFIFAPPR